MWESGTKAGPGCHPLAPPRPVGLGLGCGIGADATYEELREYARLGVEYASTSAATLAEAPLERLVEVKSRLESAGIRLYSFLIIEQHNNPLIVLGKPGREEPIERFKTHLRNCGKAGIPYITYAHMANITIGPYYATGTAYARGDIATREFDADAAARLPLSHDRVYTEEEIWDTFTYFLRAVMPTADEAGVRIGLHPDDPPLPTLGGVARVFISAAAYRRAIEIARSANFGLCLCAGTCAEAGLGSAMDPLQMIREFGPQDRIFKVHFRNVDRSLPRFRETLVDDGCLDMYSVMRALEDADFRGILIPDHIPGRMTAYTLGYTKALRDRVSAEHNQP
jgi:mannonate dehydratase